MLLMLPAVLYTGFTMGRLRRNIAGAMAGVALGAAAERTAVAATPGETAPTEESVERHASDGRAKRYEAEFGMLDGDAEALSRQVDILFGDDAEVSDEAFRRIVQLLEDSATTPPSVFGLIAFEAKTHMKPNSEVAVGSRFRLVHAPDGRISVIDPKGKEIILVMGSEGLVAKTKEKVAEAVVAESKPAERPDDVSAHELRDPWLVDSAEGKRGGDGVVTYEMIMSARGDKGAMTTVLLEMRNDFEGSDAAFNVQLRDSLRRMDAYWGVDSLDCQFGSYRLDDKGNLWVDAPGKEPVRVTAAPRS